MKVGSPGFFLFIRADSQFYFGCKGVRNGEEGQIGANRPRVCQLQVRRSRWGTSQLVARDRDGNEETLGESGVESQ